MSFFDSFLEIAGNLGFLVGNNDRRRERARKERRSWGQEIDGLAVSVTANSLTPGPDDSLRIEVALKNTGPEAREVWIGSWLDFFLLEIRQPDGSAAILTSFGARQIEAAKHAQQTSTILASGDVIDSDIPVGALYEMKQRGEYTVSGTSKAGRAVSNTIRIRI